jgi:uncharacterized membrane protein YqhA
MRRQEAQTVTGRDDPSPATAPQRSRARPSRLARLLALSRLLVGVAVICIFAAATALSVYGVRETVGVTLAVLGTGAAGDSAVQLRLAFIEIIDLFLIATVMYVIAIGLYQLFIDAIPLPAWLAIDDFAQLEEKLLGLVVTVLVVAFLGQVATWDGQRDLQGLGVATALVIAAVAFFLRQHAKPHRPDGGDDEGRGR